MTRQNRALFLCGKAKQRSPTAADLALGWGWQAEFAGLSNDAEEPVSRDHIDAADVIYVMEARQRKRLNALFGSALKDKRIVCLNIPDNYGYMNPDLVAILTRKLNPDA